MDDIFAAAKSGNSAAIKGLYAGSITSAYTAVSAVMEDDAQAVEIVQQAYIAALGSAKSYEEFFLLLNKRATSACAFALNKSVRLAMIIPSESSFSDTAKMPIPDALKDFDVTLAGIMNTEKKQRRKAKGIHPKKKKKDKNAKDELAGFEELVKRCAFADFDDYVPEKEPEKPKSLAEKLQGEEIALSEEQVLLDTKEKRKNKNASVLAFIFSAIILAGAVSTYFITKNIIARRAQPTSLSAGEILTEPTLDAHYPAKKVTKAFRDYINKVLVEKFSRASTERTVAYSENGNIGCENLCGVLSYRIEDIDGDKQNELAVVIADASYAENNLCTYTFKLNLYAFQGGKVVPLQEDYQLMEYRVYNTGAHNSIGEFNMLLKIIPGKERNYLYAEAGGEDIRLCAFHYFDNGKMFEAERFVRFRWDDKNEIYMQRRIDGTYEPLLLKLRDIGENNAELLSEEQRKQLGDYGFALGTQKARCKNIKALKAYFKKAFSRVGLEMLGNDMRFDTKDKSDYLSYLSSRNEQGDMLSRQTVVKLTDYTALASFLDGAAPKKNATTQKEEDVEVIIVTSDLRATTQPSTTKASTTEKKATTGKQTTKKQTTKKQTTKQQTTKKQTTKKQTTKAPHTEPEPSAEEE